MSKRQRPIPNVFRGHAHVQCSQCEKVLPGHPEPTGDKAYLFKKTCGDCGIEKHYAVHRSYSRREE